MSDKKKGALNGAKLYLSAPIEYDKNMKQDWRKPTTEYLCNNFGIQVFDPSMDEKQNKAPLMDKALDEGDYDEAEKIAIQFVKKDLGCIDRCSFLVAYNPKGVATTGTPCEVHHAVQIKKPVMIVCPEGKRFASKWYFGYIRHQYIFGSWEELFGYLKEVDEFQHTDNHRWWYTYNMI